MENQLEQVKSGWRNSEQNRNRMVKGEKAKEVGLVLPLFFKEIDQYLLLSFLKSIIGIALTSIFANIIIIFTLVTT